MQGQARDYSVRGQARDYSIRGQACDYDPCLRPATKMAGKRAGADILGQAGQAVGMTGS